MMRQPENRNLNIYENSNLKGSMLFQCGKLLSTNFASGAGDVILARLPEFIRLFLSDGLLPDLVYALELKTV